MSDRDFKCTNKGTTATITTNNLKTTQWLCDNVPNAQRQVVGGVHATIVGEPDRIMNTALALIAAGFTCEGAF